MIVTIPDRQQHEGFHSVTLEISDDCPVCGKPRGRIYGALSYDGSRRMNVDAWKNDCGHIDKYVDVREEGAKTDHKKACTFDKYEDEDSDV